MQDALRTFSMSHLTHLIEGDGGVVELVQVRVAGLVDVRPRRRLDLQENGIGFSETVGESREVGVVNLTDDISRDSRKNNARYWKRWEWVGAIGDNFSQRRLNAKNVLL